MCHIVVGGDFGTNFPFMDLFHCVSVCANLCGNDLLHYGLCINSGPVAMCCHGAADCHYGLPVIMQLIFDIR